MNTPTSRQRIIHHATLIRRAILLAFYASVPYVCAQGLTDDQLESGTRHLDRRFLAEFDAEGIRDFNAPFVLLSRWQDALQKETGIRLYFDYYADFLGNPTGGLSRGNAYSHELIFGGHFDLERILGWKGATFTASLGDGAGYNLSNKIGNYFTASQSYVQNTCTLYDLYLTQKLFNESLVFKVGRMSAGQCFASIPAFGLQVSGGINNNPASLFSNAPFTAGITSTWAAMIKYKPTETSYLSSGIFQASPRLGDIAYHGTDFSMRSGDGTLMMCEAGWKPTFNGSVPTNNSSGGGSKQYVAATSPGLPGIYKIGGYYSNYTFSQFNGGTIANAYGFYAMVQQMVWRSATDKNKNFSCWGSLVYSPQKEIDLMPVSAYTGTILQGMIPGRDQDQWLFTWMIGNFSSAYANSSSNPLPSFTPTYETVFDTSYVIQLNKYLSIQPDLQYIIRPNGYGSIANALVVGVQATLSF